MIKRLITTLLLAATTGTVAVAQQLPRTQTIAHRGDWQPEGSAQNSRTSLQRFPSTGSPWTRTVRSAILLILLFYKMN